MFLITTVLDTVANDQLRSRSQIITNSKFSFSVHFESPQRHIYPDQSLVLLFMEILSHEIDTMDMY